MANVNVNITARDLTRAELARMRRNFNSLGQDVNRAVGARNRQNFARLSQSITQARRDLTNLRGAIPDDEFFRLDAAIRRSQRTMQRGFGRVGDRAFARVVAQIREVEEGFRRLDGASQIRVRVDDSALRRADAQLRRGLADRQRAVVIRTRVEPPHPSRTRRLLVRSLTSPFRSAGGILGGTLSDGIGQGVIGGVTKGGPIIGALVAAAVLASLSFLGAAIAGALILAIGGAFVVLGGIIAAQAPVIQRNWKTAVENVKKDWANVGDALIEPMHRLIHVGERLSKEFAPHVRDAMTAAAPHVETFIEKVISGFKKLGERSAGDLEEAFNVFLAAFGPDMEGMLAGLGDALGALARTVRDHSTEVSAALTGIIGLITTVIDVINFLANAWFFLQSAAMTALGTVIKVMATMVEMAFTAVEKVLGAFSHIPLIGDKFKEAQGQVAIFKEGVVAHMRGVGQSFIDMDKNMQDANKRRILEVNISSLNAKLKLARDDLQKTNDKKVMAKINADISDLLAKKKRAQQELDNLNGKTVWTYVKTQYRSVAAPPGHAGPGGLPAGAHGGITGMAHGGISKALGARATLVGEAGPEIVNLPPGSRVRPTGETQRLMRGGGGGGSQIVIKSSGRRVDDMLIEILREAIHQRGGDPVLVLGG